MRYFVKKVFLLSLLIVAQFQLVMAATSTNAKKGAISYKEVGDSYVSSFGLIAAPVAQAHDEAKKADFNPIKLTKQEKRGLIFEIMGTHEVIGNENPAVDDAMRVTLADLDAYYGAGKSAQETLMNTINNTITGFGDAQLAFLFSIQVKELDKLKARQALVKAFAENPELAARVEQILAQVKQAESGFLSYWRTIDPVTQKLINDLYFSKSMLKRFNNSRVGLEFLTRSGNLGTVYQLTNDMVLFFGLNYVMAKIAAQASQQMSLKGPDGSPLVVDSSLKGVAKSTYQSVKSFFNPYDYYAQVKNVKPQIEQTSSILELQGNPPMTAEMKSVMEKMGYGLIGAQGAIAIGMLTYKYFTAKKALEQAALTKNSINYLQTKLIDVATIVNACKAINKLGQQEPEVAQGVLSFAAFEQLLHGNDNADFKELVDLLQTNTFRGEASFFSLSGKVLAANQLMIQEKNQFVSALQALGELDACLSMAKLYNKMKAERVNYCFVNFVEKDKPYVKAVNFWNPFVNAQKVVTNSLELGQGADASKVILTGSNTGGKSTILKALMIDLLMAGTFGIAPAQELTMTQFTFIGSYLRVNDDTASGESKFKAEVLRAKMLTEALASLQTNEFAFIVMDELFTGTNSVNASEAAKKVATNLAGFTNSLYILATHFPALTELQAANPGVIKNYKVDIYKDDAGNLMRPFKLESGISTSNVAIDILNEEIQTISF